MLRTRAIIMKAFLAISAVLPFLALTAQPVTVQLQFINGGRTEPVAIANADDPRLFVAERQGRIYILNADGTWVTTPFLDITDRVNDGGGEQGLLGLAFHPDYATNGYFYVYYTGGSGVGTCRVARFSRSTSNPNDALETSEFDIWTRSVPGTETNHRGGDLHFGPDGYLWFSVGDAGGSGDPSNYAQDLSVPWGKIMRIDVDGGTPYAIPPTNPYAAGAVPEIRAHGLRNPWRFSIDEVSGDVWIGDVGQYVYEEIDRWPGGDNTGPNFGWRCYEGTAGYNTTGCGAYGTYDAPVVVHNQNTGWCAIVGGHVYRGAAYPRLQGRYIYTDWCTGSFVSLRYDGTSWVQETLLASGVAGYAAIGESASGELYTCNQQNGEIRRIIDPVTTVRVSAQIYLEGCFDNASDRMRDDLRAAGLIPAAQPYSALGFEQFGSGSETVGPAVLAVTGDNAIVDWVRLELRSSAQPATIVATANALVQRDGDVVATDGVSPVPFAANAGNYFVAVRHRNHLGIMTATTRALSATATTIDFRVAGTSTYGTAARKTLDAHRLMWAGNTIQDDQLVYVGGTNDRDPILVAVGGSVPTNTVTGYRIEDVTMDGITRYVGGANDRDPILVNIGGTVPTNVRLEQLP